MCLAVPGGILSVSADEGIDRHGRISFGGVVKDVSLAYVPEARVGDYVIVHAGFAISLLDEEEAHAVLTQFDALTALQREP